MISLCPSVEDHLCASEQGYGFAALLVGDGRVPHLRRAATVDELRFAGDRTVTFGPDEVALQLDSREALCAFRQVDERTVAARGICQGDHRRRVQVAVRGHELLAQIEAARDPTSLRLQDLEPDETWQGSHTSLVQLDELGHATHLLGHFSTSPDYLRAVSKEGHPLCKPFSFSALQHFSVFSLKPEG